MDLRSTFDISTKNELNRKVSKKYMDIGKYKKVFSVCGIFFSKVNAILNV
jgi:hypothetical protein